MFLICKDKFLPVRQKDSDYQELRTRVQTLEQILIDCYTCPLRAALRPKSQKTGKLKNQKVRNTKSRKPKAVEKVEDTGRNVGQMTTKLPGVSE